MEKRTPEATIWPLRRLLGVLVTGQVCARLGGFVQTRFVGSRELEGLDAGFEVYEIEY